MENKPWGNTSKTVGSGFKSLCPCQKSPTAFAVGLFWLVQGLEKLNATRMSVAAEGSTEANLYFLSVRKKMQTSPCAPAECCDMCKGHWQLPIVLWCGKNPQNTGMFHCYQIMQKLQTVSRSKLVCYHPLGYKQMGTIASIKNDKFIISILQ